MGGAVPPPTIRLRGVVLSQAELYGTGEQCRVFLEFNLLLNKNLHSLQILFS
jgi:hypothetical protein